MPGIEIAAIDELIRTLREKQRRFAFLVGAGTSRVSGFAILFTGGQLR